MPIQLPTVFISSPHRDLVEYRSKVIDAVRTIGLFPMAMEVLPGHEDPPIEHCLNKLDQSDFCVVIVGNSYGSRPPERRRSYTWTEYEHARKKRIPIRVFLIDQTACPSTSECDGGDDAKQLEEFKGLLRKRHTPKTFRTPDDLAIEVVASLVELRLASGQENQQPFEHATTVSDIEGLFSRATVSLRTWPQQGVDRTSGAVRDL
ncbi:MAG: hypothetical protein B7Z55_07935 [Planctomycetales bacterium 12-60-4]|nr:MAG: hypothetical protein B7Z55_07935 [Planctomycetales bacterium 12-60-4]